MLRRGEICDQEWLVLILTLMERLTWVSLPKRLLQLVVEHLRMVQSWWTGRHWHHLWRQCLCSLFCCSSSHLLLAFSSACQRVSLGSVERFLVPLSRIQVTPLERLQQLLLHHADASALETCWQSCCLRLTKTSQGEQRILDLWTKTC